MTITNPIQKMIYQVIVDDIMKQPRGFSSITNREIHSKLSINVSQNSVRDHCIWLVNKGFIQRVDNYWDEHFNFYNRALYLGKISPTNVSTQ